MLIEEPAGKIRMLVGVECRDRGRPGTVEWVQQMRGKHQHRTDKLVLVSRSGFTKMALDEAGRDGIEAMSLAEAREADWNVIVNKRKEVFVGRSDFHISTGYAVLDEEYGLTHDPVIGPEQPPHSANDESIGPVGEIARERLQQPDAGRELMELCYRNQDRTRATATFEAPAGSYLIDTSGTKRCVRAFRLEVFCEMGMTPVALRHGAMGAAHVAWGQATAGDEELFLVNVEHQGQPGTATLRLTRKGQETQQLVDMVDAEKP